MRLVAKQRSSKAVLGADEAGDLEDEEEKERLLLPLSLAVWVDASVVEAFALGGRGRVTSRIYPLQADVLWGVAAWAELGRAADDHEASSVAAKIVTEIEVHELESCWVDDLRI